MFQIAIVEGAPEARPCDVLLVHRAVHRALLPQAIADADIPEGKACRTLPGSGTAADRIVLCRRDSPREWLKDAFDAASALDNVRIVCVPLPNGSGRDAASSFADHLAAIDSLGADAPPQLRLIEFVGSDPVALEACLAAIAQRPRASASKPTPPDPLLAGTDDHVREQRAAALRIRSLVEEGNLIQAYTELAGLDGDSRSEEIDYLEVLVLARMGDTDEAIAAYERLGVGKHDSIDAQALKARLLKDQALRVPPTQRARYVSAAGDYYFKVFQRTKDYFPLVNAATLAFLADAIDQARERAQKVLLHPEVRIGDGYWALVTRAEALVVLGRYEEAREAVGLALAQPDATVGARSSTMRQLARMRDHLGDSDGLDRLLDSGLRPPPVIHYCGHIFTPDAAIEAELRKQVETALPAGGATAAFGSLAAGSDLLVAEHFLGDGVELNVVLPLDIGEFVDQSVRPAGALWVRRFEKCLNAATSVSFATKMRFTGDQRLFDYGTEVAMGMAAVQARHLATDALQLALWDGETRNPSVGTGASVERWRRSGRKTIAIDPGPIQRATPARSDDDATGSPHRAVHAILFADFAGFSRIPESALPHFWREVMGRTAAVIERFGAAVACRNTWGDAVYLVIEDAATAADIALEMQRALREADLKPLGLADPGMRIALHLGPMYRDLDPVTGSVNFFGTEVSRAARLEPVTPPRSIYATEPFAAILSIEAGDRFELNYAGALPLAKGYGSSRVYRLRRRRLDVAGAA